MDMDSLKTLFDGYKGQYKKVVSRVMMMMLSIFNLYLCLNTVHG